MFHQHRISMSSQHNTSKLLKPKPLAAALVMMLAGSATAAQAAAPVVLSATQQQSIQNAFHWHTRDAGIQSNVITPSMVFAEIPGLKERSNYLNVKVKSRTQMIEQITRDAAIAKQYADSQNADSQTHAANNIDTTQIDAKALFESLLADADTRLIEARTRLAPSLREGYADIDMHSVQIPAGVSAEVAAEALMLTGDYEYVSIDWLCYPTTTTPNDSLFNTQYCHGSGFIDTVGAWDFTQGSSDTIIGVCDSGVDLDHPDLMSSLVPGFNAVDNLAQADGGNVNDDFVGHGTLVAGSAAARGNNSIGVSGVGWNFGIMPIRVSNTAGGTALLSDILEGARWASDNGAYTANCSFGGAEDSATLSTGGHIRLEGHLLVFAAGNDGFANQVNDWAKVTIVGASNQADNWVGWSHTGVGIDCIAPGVNIRSTNRLGGYTYTTGTSFSAPITAGALMLVHDANPALSADEVEFLLLNSCDDKQAPGEDDQTGWGRINVGQAVNDAVFGPSITSLPFEDTFADLTLSTDWRNPIGTIDVSSDGINEPSAPYALNLDDSDSIETIAMRTAFLAGNPGKISIATQHRGVEAGETLTLEYLNFLSTWTTINTFTSDGSNQEEFSHWSFLMPIDGMHDQFKLRLSAAGSDNTDDWYIDDVAVSEFTNNTLGWEDSFEDGITLTLDWASSNATASQDALNEPDGTTSALLNNQDSMTSAEVDVSLTPDAIYYHFYSQHRGVEAGETLLVEYLTLLGAWNTLTTIVSDGNDQSSFELTQIGTPFDAYGGTTALRFTADGDEADDSWFIDLVAVTNDFIVIDPPCPADLNDDGLYNFFDISLFLQAFGALDPVADFNGDGLYNFFDISVFLSDFSAGCP